MLLIADAWVYNNTDSDVVGVTSNGLGVIRVGARKLVRGGTLDELTWSTTDVIGIHTDPCHIGIIDTNLGSVIVPGILLSELDDFHSDWLFVTQHPLHQPHQSFELDICELLKAPLSIEVHPGNVVSARRLIVQRIKMK